MSGSLPNLQNCVKFSIQVGWMYKALKARLSEAEYLLIYLLVRVKNNETGTIFCLDVNLERWPLRRPFYDRCEKCVCPTERRYLLQ